MRKWIVMFAFRRKIGSFLLIYGYAPVPILHRSIKITFNPNEHCPGRCILCTLVFDIIQNFCRIRIFGFSSKTKDSTVFQNIWKQFFKQSMHQLQQLQQHHLGPIEIVKMSCLFVKKKPRIYFPDGGPRIIFDLTKSNSITR